MANDLVVADLSHWNEVTSFKDAAEAGLIGVIHKATEGASIIDATYAGRRTEALDAGLLWSSYHYLRHGDIASQVEFYLDAVMPEDGERVCIDYEDGNCTLDDLRETIERIRSEDETVEITVYGGHLLKEQLGDAHDGILATTSLWIAQYRDGHPEWPTGTWPVWSLHQYSDGSAGGYPRGVPGISAPHDCNRFNGSRQACAAWIGPASEEIGDVVEVAINAPEGVEIHVSVNGEKR